MARNHTIQHKRTSVAGNKPTAAQVAVGELAINFPDKTIYTQDTLGNIIPLAQDVEIVAADPASAAEGQVIYNTTDDSVKVWDGTAWFNTSVTGLPALPANTTHAAGSGTGTSGDPYVYTATGYVGYSKLIDQVTISGLAPFQVVPGSSDNSRFYLTNYIADATGVLKTNIMYNDTPTSNALDVHTGNIVVGTGSVYFKVDITVDIRVVPFANPLNWPTGLTPATTNWTAPADTITATGDILISTDGVTYGQGPLAVTTGDTVYTKWNGDPNSGVGIDQADGTTINGTITDQAGGTDTGSLTIDKTPDAFTFTDVTGVGTSANQDSNTITVSGTNSYIYLTSPDTGSYSVDGLTWTAIPAAQTATDYVVEGDTFQVRHTSSSSPTTTVDQLVNAGTISDTFSSTTMASGIATPTITSPLDLATDVSTSATITSSAASTIAATHDRTDWELLDSSGTVIGSVTQSFGSTSIALSAFTLTTINPGTTYKIRVRYWDSVNTIYSAFSPEVTFTTASGPSITCTAIAGANTGQALMHSSVAASGTNVIASGESEYYTSSDGGVTWTTRLWSSQSANPWRSFRHNIEFGSGSAMAIVNDSVLNKNILIRSTDNGASWTKVTFPNLSDGFAPGNMKDITYDSSTNTYYAYMYNTTNGTSDGTKNGILKSTDEGVTWTEVAYFNDSWMYPSLAAMDGILFKNGYSCVSVSSNEFTSETGWSCPPGAAGGAYKITKTNGKYYYFAITSSYNFVSASSADGVTWTNTANAATYDATGKISVWGQLQQVVSSNGYTYITHSTGGVYMIADADLDNNGPWSKIADASCGSGTLTVLGDGTVLSGGDTSIGYIS